MKLLQLLQRPLVPLFVVAVIVIAFVLILGPEKKHATVFALVAALLLALPPVRQNIAAYIFAKDLQKANRSQTVANMAPAMREGRLKDLTDYSSLDTALNIAGALLLAYAFYLELQPPAGMSR